MTDERAPGRSRCIRLTQLPQDVREMEERLKAAFPAMRFVSIPVCRRGGNPELFYLDSLLDNPRPGARLFGWIEPEGWEPLWGYSANETLSDLSELLCRNVPRKSFLTAPLEPPREYFVHRRLLHDPTKLALQRMHYLEHGVVICHWRLDDDEAKRFAQKVMRLVVKDTDKTCFSVDHMTGLADSTANKSLLWVAKHARAWVRESPDRFLEDHERPGDDPEDYRWDLPVDGDLCLLKRPEEERPKPGLLFDEEGRRRRLILAPSMALPASEEPS